MFLVQKEAVQQEKPRAKNFQHAIVVLGNMKWLTESIEVRQRIICRYLVGEKGRLRTSSLGKGNPEFQLRSFPTFLQNSLSKEN